MNITLIGMPGCGKSTIGVLLAKTLGYRFLDTDLLIQEKEDRLLSDILEEEGMERFIEIENQVNAQVDVKRTVIAPGGSAIYGREAMEHFKEIGKVVYIQLSYETVADRLGDLKARGVVMKDGQTLKQLYEERCPMYEHYADVVIRADNKKIGDILAIIKKELFH